MTEFLNLIKIIFLVDAQIIQKNKTFLIAIINVDEVMRYKKASVQCYLFIIYLFIYLLLLL